MGMANRHLVVQLASEADISQVTEQVNQVRFLRPQFAQQTLVNGSFGGHNADRFTVELQRGQTYFNDDAISLMDRNTMVNHVINLRRLNNAITAVKSQTPEFDKLMNNKGTPGPIVSTDPSEIDPADSASATGPAFVFPSTSNVSQPPTNDMASMMAMFMAQIQSQERLRREEIAAAAKALTPLSLKAE